MTFDDLVKRLLSEMASEGIYRYSGITGSQSRYNRDTKTATSKAAIKSLETALQRHTKHKFAIFIDDTSELEPHIRYGDIPNDIIGIVINTSVFEDDGTEPPEAGFFGITPWMIGHRLGHLVPKEVMSRVVLSLCKLIAKNHTYFMKDEVVRAQDILKNPDKAVKEYSRGDFFVGFIPNPPTITKLFAFKSAKRPFNYFYAAEYQGEYNDSYNDNADEFNLSKYKQQLEKNDFPPPPWSDQDMVKRFNSIRYRETPPLEALELYRDIFAQYIKFGKVTIRYPNLSITKETSQEIESIFSNWLDTLGGSMWHLNFDPRSEESMGRLE